MTRQPILPKSVKGRSNDEDSSEYLKLMYKYVLIGDVSVGKSSFVYRSNNQRIGLNGEFSVERRSTVGCDFSTMEVEVANETIKIQIWDTAGSERYRALTPLYYRNANGIFLVYDITNRCTFESLSGWLIDIELNSNTNPVLFLIGNKSDLRSNREVTYREANDFAAKYDLMFAETSAKTGAHIFDSVLEMTRKIYDRFESIRSQNLSTMDEASQSDQIKLSDDERKNKSKCRC